MIALAWSLFVVASFLMATNQAFLTGPVPVQAASGYDVTGLDRRLEGNEVLQKTSNNNDNDEDKNNNNGNNRNQRLDEDEQTVYVIEFESESNEKEESLMNKGKESSSGDGESQNLLDPWSIVWYIGSFGGLVAFFLIVSCSEWCCRRGGRPLANGYGPRTDTLANGQVANETPPPPYHLFAPPSYESVNYGDLVVEKSCAREKLDIYVISVPIHAPVLQVAS